MLLMVSGVALGWQLAGILCGLFVSIVLLSTVINLLRKADVPIPSSPITALCSAALIIWQYI